ncbi:MAG: hypothetical protein AAFY02_03515 [Pseudomonadota bacterium]
MPLTVHPVAIKTSLAAAALLALSACSGGGETQERVLTGAAVGAGVGAGGAVLSGGCIGCGAVVGGALGAGAGYLFDRAKREDD